MLMGPKKQKTETNLVQAEQGRRSKVFAPFRTLGVVSESVPFAVTSLGQSFVLTTVVGESFQIYDALNLRLFFVSAPPAPGPIVCIHSHHHFTFAIYQNTLALYKRARLQNAVALPGVDAKSRPLKIVTFGEFLCVCTTSKLFVYKWNPKTFEMSLYTEIKPPRMLGELVDVCHPPTYLNKVIIATQSCLVLYNVKTGSLVHTFDETPSGISFIDPCTIALDVVSIVSPNGDISLMDIKRGTTLVSLSVGEPVTSLSFRSDACEMLCVGTLNGDVFVYDLNRRSRVHSLRSLHGDSRVTKTHFLHQQPLLLTAGADNKVVQLVFDPPVSRTSGVGPAPRVLRQRGGHSRPPTKLSFTDEEGHHLLSGSIDRTLWSFSLRSDSQSHEFSQKSKSKKSSLSLTHGRTQHDRLPAIVDVAYSPVKQNQWDNVLTCHKTEPFARSWSGKRGALGDYQLQTLDNSLAKCVAISPCGNFGLVGSVGGSIACYNLQSGILRKQFRAAHTRAVTGIAVDAVNTTVVSSSLDGKLRFHSFQTLELLQEIDLKAAITDLRLHLSSGLVAVATDDLGLYVVDIVTKKVVRELWGHASLVTSFDFTPDGRWLLSGSLDNTLKTWDIPSGGCVDSVKLEMPVSCLRISPNNEWLATSHVQGLGIQIWTMKPQVHKLSLLPADQINATEELPTVSGADGVLDTIVADQDEAELDLDFDIEYEAVEQLQDQLQTLSLQPRHKFNALLHLEAIKERNKATQVEKTPQPASFFLGLPQDRGHSEDANIAEASITPNLEGVDLQSKFTDVLAKEDYEGIIECLVALGPSATDVVIRSLVASPPYTEIIVFIQAMTHQIRKRKSLELIQAWMHLLFQVHGDVLAESPADLNQALHDFYFEESQELERLNGLNQYCSGVFKYLRAL